MKARTATARRLRAVVAGCALALSARGAGSGGASAAPPVTAERWRTHPRVVEIRRLVEANEAAIARGAWRREDRPGCRIEERPLEADLTAFRDERGRVRKYVTSAGTDDSAYRVEHQYDDRGRLRFAYATAGAANGSREEYRIYLAEDGSELWRHVTTSGPGYTFMRPPEFPDGMLVRDAARDLARTRDCEAEYGRRRGPDAP